MAEPEWISACPTSDLRAGVLSIPPARTLDADASLALSVAVFLDDLDPDGGDGSATALATDLMGPLTDYVTQTLDRKLRRFR